MTRKASSRFAQIAAAQSAAGQSHPRPTVGQIRNAERAAVQRFNDNRVSLPNPSVKPPFDRHGPQPYLNKVEGLGLAPNLPKHFYELERGDAGAASSIFRRTTVFHELGAAGTRVLETPYSKAIAMATMASSDQRPRYFHISLYSVGLVLPVIAPTAPFDDDLISAFASGITIDNQPVPVPSIVPTFGVPLPGTVKFRILVQDESGGRTYDVDALGTRSMNLFGFAVTVFVLIKENGYEVDRQQIEADPGATTLLGPGLLEQAIVGARIIPIRTNETKNTNNRTVGVNHPGGGASRNIIVPPGALRVQLFDADPAPVPPVGYAFDFRTSNQLAAVEGGVVTGVGTIEFEPGEARTIIYDIPNANVIRIDSSALSPPRLFNAVFEVTS